MWGFGGFGVFFFWRWEIGGAVEKADAGIEKGSNFCANAPSHGGEGGDLINVGIKRSCETCCRQHYIDPFLAWSITKYKSEWQLSGAPSGGVLPVRWIQSAT